jgi:HSP20 family protein
MLPILKRNSIFPSFVDEFFGKDLPAIFNMDNGISSPSVNILEGKEDFRIQVAAPGLEKNDFRINLQNNVLTISSDKETSSEVKEERFMRREFNFMQFSRSFSLPVSCDSEKINATYTNGVLSIVIPKKDEAREKPGREIAIS